MPKRGRGKKMEWGEEKGEKFVKLYPFSFHMLELRISIQLTSTQLSSGSDFFFFDQKNQKKTNENSHLVNRWNFEQKLRVLAEREQRER
jgi:hypothetical protein